MQPLLIAAAVVVAIVWLAFVYRFLANPLVRRRAIVLRATVLTALIVLGTAVPALLWPGVASGSVLGAGAAVAGAALAASTWVVVGASRDRVMERTRFVLRGMGLMELAGEDARVVADQRGIVRVRVGGPHGAGARLLRVQTARGIKKAVLFRRNIWKTLAASARGE